MPLNEQEWTSIHNMVEREVNRIIGKRMDYFIMTKVNSVDVGANNIYVDEFGPTPVPMFAFEYEVRYYVPNFTTGAVEMRLAKVKPLPPEPEDTVLICREMGADRLPRCIGVLQSRGFLIDEDE